MLQDGKKTQITGTEVASEEDQRPPEWYTRGPGDLAPPIHLSVSAQLHAL